MHGFQSKFEKKRKRRITKERKKSTAVCNLLSLRVISLNKDLHLKYISMAVSILSHIIFIFNQGAFVDVIDFHFVGRSHRSLILWNLGFCH